MRTGFITLILPLVFKKTMRSTLEETTIRFNATLLGSTSMNVRFSNGIYKMLYFLNCDAKIWRNVDLCCETVMNGALDEFDCSINNVPEACKISRMVGWATGITLILSTKKFCFEIYRFL